MSTDAAISLSDADLVRVMQLIKGSDSVELKVTVPIRPGGRRSRACRSTRSRRSLARFSSSTRQTWLSTRPVSSFAPGASRVAAVTPS